jgi:endonuclease/exonuclease/phosphatase (EEP) superfamily protein YafD
MCCFLGALRQSKEDGSFLPTRKIGNPSSADNNRSTINFLLFNPRSLNNKIEKFMTMLQDNKIDIAGICETWLTDANSPITAAIRIHGYSIIHHFRGDMRGGGTALIYKTCYTMAVTNLSSNLKTFEYTAATIKTARSKKVLFIIIYRTGSLTSLFNQELDALLSVAFAKCDSIIVAGDLNIHFNVASNNGIISQSLSVLNSYGMVRQIYDATHVNGGSLDQIFTFSMNKQLTCTHTIDQEIRLGSDHFPVLCNFSFALVGKYFKSLEYRNIKNMDTASFSDELACIVNKGMAILDSSFEKAASDFSHASVSLLDEYAPIIKKKVAVVDSAPWFDSEYRNLRKKRRKAESNWKSTKSQEDKTVYKELCSETTTLALTKKKEYFSKVITKSNGNARTLYSMVDKELDRKQSKILPDTEDIADLTTKFNKFFVEKIDKIRKNMDNKPLSESDEFINVLSEFEPTTIDEVREIINETGIKCSPADPLPQLLVKQNIDILLPIIVKMVNLSLSTGNVDGMKLADIIPLLKDDSLDPNVLNNFRPVSNLLFLGKVIEKVVLKRLNDHLSKNNLHCSDQSAYKKNHSTETLLVKITNDILVASDSRSATVVMLLDLSAAFDTVDHKLLLNILAKEIGLKGTVLAWFRSFLMGRSQRVRLGIVTSETILIKFGVPQGSVLGPVLFNLYIRSIYNCVKRLGFDISGYADDHQILKSFKPNEQLSLLAIQLDNCFNTIKSWMSDYYLKMNDSKTQIIIFGPSKVLGDIRIRGLNTTGTAIRFISTVKNLGIMMDSHLTFEKQVVELKKKCFRTLRNLAKIRFLLTQDQLKVIVNSLVVSCLDYCNCIFYGIAEKLLCQLQLIQNAAAKIVTGKYKHDHLGDDLRNLHWLNIKKRIVFKIGLLAYKSINGIAPEYLQDMFKYCHHGHKPMLIVPAFNTQYGRRSFSVTGPRLFNRLPTDVTSATNVDLFKGAMKTFLFKTSLYDVDRLLSFN